MENNLKINVKLTLKDLKDYSFGKAFSRISAKINIILQCIVLCITIFGALFLSISYPQLEIFPFIIYIIIFELILILTFMLPFLLIYITQINNFKKSRLMGQLQCYEFTDYGAVIISGNGTFSFKWSDVYKIKEQKQCILILLSPYKNFIIPRRCFHSQEQLNMLNDIFISNVDKKKLKLKGYRMKTTMPDFGEVPTKKENVQATDQEDIIDPLLKVVFSLSRNELLKANFRLYYTTPVGVIMTVIGIISLFSYIVNTILKGYNPPILLILGIIFVFLQPIIIYNFNNRQFAKDVTLKKEYTYTFYPEFFLVNHANGNARIDWSNLVKAVELKEQVLLFPTTQIAHIVPKKAFEDRKEDIGVLRKIIKEKVKKNNIK